MTAGLPRQIKTALENAAPRAASLLKEASILEQWASITADSVIQATMEPPEGMMPEESRRDMLRMLIPSGEEEEQAWIDMHTAQD